MPPKAKLPAPIDRPLSRAYQREFSGWSTAYPPGVSEPTSQRILENMMVNRDGTLRLRPAIKYLSYETPPAELLESVPYPGDPVFVGSIYEGHPAAVDSVDSIDMPVGTAIGDLVVLTCYGQGGRTEDPRFELVGLTRAGDGAPGSMDGMYYRDCRIYVGHATTLDPVSVIMANGMKVLTAFRGVDGVPLQYDLSQVNMIAHSTNPAEVVPGLDSMNLSGALFVHISSGGVGGVYGLQDWSKAPAYTNYVASDLSYVEVDIAMTTQVPVPAQTTPSTASDWAGAIIGIKISETAPGSEVVTPEGGVAYSRRFVGTHEPFYLNDGRKAYLCAVREEDNTVGFRVLLFDDNLSAMYDLTDPIVDFDIPQTTEVLNFSEDTTYVKYLQIDNKIFALSDNGEPLRVFYVGEDKVAKALAEITVPTWETTDKLDVMHPEAAWINARTPNNTYGNWVPNPSFETGLHGWKHNADTKLTRPQTPPITPVSGTRVMRLESAPQRTNLVISPLHNVASTGIEGWTGSTGEPTLVADASWLKAIPQGKGSFFARSARLPGVEPGKKYQVAFDFEKGAHVDVKARLTFYRQNGDIVGEPKIFDVPDVARYAGATMVAPKNAVSATVAIGGINTTEGATFVRFKKVMLCLESEITTFFHGGSGANYFWTGTTNKSASVYHPPATVGTWTDKLPAKANYALTTSVHVAPGSTTRTVTLRSRRYDKNGKLLETVDDGGTAETAATFTRLSIVDAATPAKTAKADLHIQIPNVARGEYHYVDAAMIQRRPALHDYFDGSTPKETLAEYGWSGTKHNSRSFQKTYDAYEGLPTPETMTADTLRATGGLAANPFTFAFFYTFENEVGESAASRITTRRAKRAWSEWIWETPDVNGEPSGTTTDIPEAAADQLVALMPEEVFNQALDEGATSWALYMFTWSDQDIVPIVGLKVAERELKPDSVYADSGWLQVTPQQVDVTEDMALPTENNRVNYSKPSGAGQGLVAADRMILVHDPNTAGVIRWSSNRMGEYTNFTSRIGGGFKTLVSGNLYVPAACVLWQNPQSTDTLTILCQGTDGRSVSYYMAPAEITGQTDTTQIMGFEETTATPGTTSPYGVEVLNNALWHPLDEGLMKSTASNYNINHKMVAEQIGDKWVGLVDKQWIMSSQLDNRLYYLVNNPEGALLEDDCKGNELWVFDTASEAGSWSRFLIQGHALRKIEYGNKVYMSVVHPDGVFFLDPDDWLDDYVDADTLEVVHRPIPFKMETNTQGANRAHDAWAHVQQATLTLGNFAGALRWGVRGFDLHGKPIEFEKITRNNKLYAYDPDNLAWDQDDHLKIARQMKEWFFFAESVDDDTEFTGQLSAVQYRYTPISVNVGYEYGSVETFEYSRDVALAPSSVTENGVPLPYVDTRRP